MSFEAALWPIVAAWAVVVVLGGALVVYSVRAWRTGGNWPMLFLAAGFAFLSAVPALMWFGTYFTTENLFMASVACVWIMAAGFGFIVLALRTRLR